MDDIERLKANVEKLTEEPYNDTLHYAIVLMIEKVFKENAKLKQKLKEQKEYSDEYIKDTDPILAKLEPLSDENTDLKEENDRLKRELVRATRAIKYLSQDAEVWS